MKVEAFTGGVLQSAFNNFAKFIVKHLYWSLFLIKLQACWCATLSRKKTLAQVISCKFSETFKKTYFAEHVRTDAWVKWTKKIYLQENTGDGVLYSAVAEMWAYSFSKIDFITDAFLWKLWSFIEHQFYRTMLRDCFWFPDIFNISLALSVTNQFSLACSIILSY